SFAWTKSTRPGTRLLSSASFPDLSRLVATKMNGPDTATSFWPRICQIRSGCVAEHGRKAASTRAQAGVARCKGRLEIASTATGSNPRVIVATSLAYRLIFVALALAVAGIALWASVPHSRPDLALPL